MVGKIRTFRKCIEQRKTLQPYIEECARRVSEEGYHKIPRRSGRHYEGGIYMTVPVDLEAIPVFRRV